MSWTRRRCSRTVSCWCPDTPANLAEFGKSGTGPQRSPHPQIRAVGLAGCGTHAIIAAAFDSRNVYERQLLKRILDSFQQGMVVPADRG
jgi:hypothetical protein